MATLAASAAKDASASSSLKLSLRESAPRVSGDTTRTCAERKILPWKGRHLTLTRQKFREEINKHTRFSPTLARTVSINSS
mmetsp:Transcript_14891/g.48580  ORF Transcript_14891/g.48580 Transcript_14891/m.48580 type:complete len:81 (-) Transcript_14891:379-621(-)